MASTEQKTVETSCAPTRQMLWRVRGLRFVLVVICFALIVGQLINLQLVQGEQLRQAAVAQQLSDITISPNRGQIYDCHMNLLAQTIEVCTVIMSPRNIKDEQTRVRIADEVSAVLEIDRDKLYQQTQDSHSQYKEIARRIDKEKGDAFIQWANENGLASVFYVITDYKRNYPMNTLLSSVMGFVNTEVGTSGRGAEGIEYYYNDVLSGTAGRLITALNAQGDELPNSLTYKSAVDAKNGNSLVLTIDQYIQQVTEKYLDEAVASCAAKNRGCAIVMDVDTCAILAMATSGDYDLNHPRTIADATAAERAALLAGDEQSEAVWAALKLQWRNKAVADYYEPGSVFKTFTASAALDENIASEKSIFDCNGYFSLPGANKMKCHVYPRSHGKQTLEEAISNSCNPAFMQLGLQIGADLFFKYYTGFGFTEKTGVDLPGESDVSASLYHNRAGLTDVSLATSAIGQTFKVTPLQIINAMCAVAGDGYLRQPYIVAEIRDADGSVVSETKSTVRRQVISEQTSERMAAILAKAVDGGGSKNAYVAGYRVAAKTGTGVNTDQQVEEEDKDVWASCAAFAPADHPQVAVLVMVDSPTIGQYDGTICAPVVKKIYEQILPYLGVEPEYTEAEISKLNTTAPNVEGKTVQQAEKSAQSKSLRVQVLGKGGTVLQQVPAAGSSIAKDGTLVLYTDSDSLEQTVAVPDLNGKSLAQVKKRAAELGLNLIVQGISTEQGKAQAAVQSIEAGSTVLKGTVITVEFVYQDTTG
ncbi:MAG: PASTA domain-containing protein [Clostridia bacterium]|nr:PASTA domain-containing protein [Clostridia bacterium]